MTSDLCLISHSTKSNSVELSVECLCNRFAKRGLTDTWWTVKAQNSALVVLGQLSDSKELDNPLFDHVETIVISFKNLRGFGRV